MVQDSRRSLTASDFARRLEGVQGSDTRFVAKCPAHEDQHASLSVTEQAGKVLVYCFAGCTYRQILSALQNASPQECHFEPRRVACVRTAERNCIEKVRKIWSEANFIQEGDAAWSYLTRVRGFSNCHIPTVLRSTPSLPYWLVENNKPVLVGAFPAMVSRVDSFSGELIAVHVTYLTKDGEKLPASIGPARKLRVAFPGATKGGAIRLSDATDRLAVCEGIETGIALRHLSGWPTWAAVTAGGLENIKISASVSEVLIGGDNDRSGRGQQAADRLARRLSEAGIKVKLAIPKRGDDLKTRDWADVAEAENERAK